MLKITDDFIKKVKTAFKLHVCESEVEEIDRLEKTIQRLETMFYKEDECNKSEIYWNAKKPEATILYRGRTLPTTTYRIDIDVRSFITPSDPWIMEDVKSNDLLISDINNCDTKIVEIYKFIQEQYYNYEFDSKQFGVPELWMFPFELTATSDYGAENTRKGDCDDWGIYIASYLIAAGVPYWRVRCVVGTTWSGFGHLTVYVLDDTLKTWRHINSTTPSSALLKQSKLTDFPRSNDPDDSIGIRDVWFSFSKNPKDVFQKTSWHEFETSTELDDYREDTGEVIEIIR